MISAYQDPAYRDALSVLYQRSNAAGIKMDLSCIRALLAALGNPHAGLRCVVVAGTNGKGSTSALIARALQEAGHRVGLYTSPHLLRFTERIRVDGAEIGPAQAADLARRVLAHDGDCPRPPTFFECVTAMALVYFAEQRVDVAVLEVGLGGRLDATNAVDKVLTVLTPIAYDHQQFLGNTLTSIAGEKAAIMQAGVPAVVAPQADEAMAVIEAQAKALGAPLRLVPRVQSDSGEHVAGASDSERLGRQAPWKSTRAPGPLQERFWPVYLSQNRATAEAACAVLHACGVSCPPEAFASAAATFVWPGRYQWYDGPPPVLVDGAHNIAGMDALLAALSADARVGARPIHAVFSAVYGKDAENMIAALRRRVTSLHLCGLPSRRGRTGEDLRALDAAAAIYPTAADAFPAAQSLARQDGGLVLVAGSLFLVADVQALLEKTPRDPPVDG